jgi:hypothetical protein
MRATVFDLLRAPWYHPTLAEIITYPLEEIAAQVNGSTGPSSGRRASRPRQSKDPASA